MNKQLEWNILSIIIKEYHLAHMWLSLGYIWLNFIYIVLKNTYEKNLESVLFTSLYGKILAARNFVV